MLIQSHFQILCVTNIKPPVSLTFQHIHIEHSGNFSKAYAPDLCRQGGTPPKAVTVWCI
jgi:hypothetical protein